MTKIKTESEFRFEFRAYCKASAAFQASDEKHELSSLENDLPERSAKALRKFYKKAGKRIMEDERYRQAKRNVSVLPFDIAFDAIETPATVAAYVSNPIYMEKESELAGKEVFVSDPNPLFWKLEATPYFSDFIYLERKQIVLAWIGERLKVLNESDLPAGAISTDDKAAPATREPESQTTVNAPIDGKEAPATGPADQNPLSVLSQRQLALWVYYRQHREAKEMEDFENMGFPTKKKAIFSFAESIPKADGSKRSGQRFEDEWRNLDKKWLDEYKEETKLKNFEAPTIENEEDHREILKHLEPSSKAYGLANETLEKIVTP